MDIMTGSIFASQAGRTVKVEKVENNFVYYCADGNIGKSLHNTNIKFLQMLEAGQYKDITDMFSNFFMSKNNEKDKIFIGMHLVNSDRMYRATIKDISSKGITVRFLTYSNE